MTANTPATLGSFTWFELATTDQNGAKQFYSHLFGWDVNDYPMGPGETYSMFKLGGRDTGAAYTMRDEQRQQGIPPFWMVYIATPNVDETANRVAALGGTVMAPPFDVMNQGRMAVVTDPAGTHFALWQPKSHGGAVMNEPGAVNWVEISVPDRSKVLKFYQDLFGWQIVKGKDMEPGAASDEYLHIVHGGNFIGGLAAPHQRDPHSPPHMVVYFMTKDIHATAAKVKSLGGKVCMEPFDVGDGSGTVAVLSDPQGAMFAVHQGK